MIQEERGAALYGVPTMFIGRLKYTVIRGGENVYPREVEEIL
jgi:acyl-CoA synthetase (AMP-forming)/AMP-acid ligase II